MTEHVPYWRTFRFLSRIGTPEPIYYWLLDQLTDNNGWRPLFYREDSRTQRRLHSDKMLLLGLMAGGDRWGAADLCRRSGLRSYRVFNALDSLLADGLASDEWHDGRRLYLDSTYTHVA